MPSDSSGGSGELPPHLDPRRGRGRRNSPPPGQPSGGSSAPGSNGALPPQLDPRGSGNRTGRRAAGAGASHNGRRGFALGVQVVAAGLSLAVLLGSGFAWASYRDLTTNLKRLKVTSSSAAGAKNIDGSDQNILITGNDDRSTASASELKALGTTTDGGSLNTDTMMLLHVPANGSKATVISFPRDSYVEIPGHGMHKLNSAYPDGVADSKGNKAAGMSLLIDTLENLTGLKIDHFVQVDLLGFYRISLAIKGVTVCLNHSMGPATYTGQTGFGYDSGYDNGVFVPSYSGINLKAGNNVIEGSQALAFVRQRHGLNSDLDRIKRQQYFLSAVFRKLVSGGTLLNPFKLQALLKAVTSSITADQTLDPAKLAVQMQNLSAGNVTFTTIPIAGDKSGTSDGDVILLNTAAIPAFVDSLIGHTTPTALEKAKAADPKTVTVAVVNDTNSNGVETTNSTALKKLGFTTTIPAATSDVLAKTTIRYPSGSEAAAKAVLAAVPGAVLLQTSTVKTVTLVLGNNGIQTKSLMPKSATTAAPSATAATTPAGTITAATAGCIN